MQGDEELFNDNNGFGYFKDLQTIEALCVSPLRFGDVENAAPNPLRRLPMQGGRADGELLRR